MENLKVTEIQIFNYGDKFSANIAINNEFMIQRGTDGEYTIPDSNEATWGSDEKQDEAAEKYNADKLAINLRIDEAIAEEYQHPERFIVNEVEQED